MPAASTSIWPLIAAAAAAVALGYVWYHPRLFGTMWMRLSNITPEMAEHGTTHIHIFALLGFIAMLCVAYVMRMLIAGLGNAVRLGGWLFAGFAVPISLGSVLWEHRPVSLYFINAGYWLCVRIMIAGILVV